MSFYNFICTFIFIRVQALFDLPIFFLVLLCVKCSFCKKLYFAFIQTAFLVFFPTSTWAGSVSSYFHNNYFPFLRFGKAFSNLERLNTSFITLCSSTERWSNGICISSQKKRQNSSIGLLLNLRVCKKR